MGRKRKNGLSEEKRNIIRQVRKYTIRAEKMEKVTTWSSSPVMAKAREMGSRKMMARWLDLYLGCSLAKTAGSRVSLDRAAQAWLASLMQPLALARQARMEPTNRATATNSLPVARAASYRG